MAQPKSSTPARVVLMCRMPWRPRLNAVRLKKHADELASKLLRTREELALSERRRSTLEIILRARLNRITELNGKIDALRALNRRLDEEAERLAEMVRFAPPVDAATLTPE